MTLLDLLGCQSWTPLLCIKQFATTIFVTIPQRLKFIMQYFLKLYYHVQLYFLKILTSFERHGHHYSTGSGSYGHHAHEKSASCRHLLPSRLQRMLYFCQIRLSLSTPTHTQVMWSRYREYLLPKDGEIRPRSCLPGNATAIWGYPDLEIPASEDQRWSYQYRKSHCGDTTI